jgi:hypothetical protein
MGISRLLDETPREISTCSLSPSGLFDLFPPSLQEIVMLLLGYSACVLIVQYGALLARKPLVKLSEDPPPLGAGGWLSCLLQLVLPEQLRPSVGEQNLKRRVLRDSVALLYRTERPLQRRLSIIQLHLHRRADPRGLPLHRLHPTSKRTKQKDRTPLLLKVSLPLAIAYPFGASSLPRYPARYLAWACRAVGSARDDHLYPPDGRLADLRQRLRDPRRTHRRCF